MVERLGRTPAEAEALRERYLREYGTTTRGLYVHDKIDIHDYLAYVHDLPLSNWLLADPELHQMLSHIPIPKCAFTNASRQHALNVASVLGIGEHFDCIFALEDFDFVSKPDPRPYQIVLDRLGARGEECVFVEDSVRNLETGKQFGMSTVLVADPSLPKPACADFVISRVHDLADALRALGVPLTG